MSEVRTRSIAKQLGVNNSYVIAVARKLHIRLNAYENTVAQPDSVRIRSHIIEHRPLDNHHEVQIQEQTTDAVDDYFECIASCPPTVPSCKSACSENLKDTPPHGQTPPCD